MPRQETQKFAPTAFNAKTLERVLAQPASPSLRTPVRGLAGHPLRLDAGAVAGVPSGQLTWRVSRRVSSGPVLEWTPRSPGAYTAALYADGRRVREVPVMIGLRPSDLVDRRNELKFYFCLIVRRGARLWFIPCPVAAGGKKSGRNSLGPSRAARQPAVDPQQALATWMQRHTNVYRRRYLPRPFLNVARVSSGLYAVFRNDIVYLGSGKAVAKVTVGATNALAALSTHTGFGGGSILRNLQSALAGLTPLEYEYAREPQWPRRGAKWPSGYSAEGFVREVLNPLVYSAHEYARAIGTQVGNGAATAVLSYSGINGTIRSRVFDPTMGVSQQVASSFDVLMTGAQRASLQSTLGQSASMFPGLGAGGGLSVGGYDALGLSSFARLGTSAMADGTDDEISSSICSMAQAGGGRTNADGTITITNTADGSEVTFGWNSSTGDLDTSIVGYDSGTDSYIVTAGPSGSTTVVFTDPTDVTGGTGDPDAGTTPPPDNPDPGTTPSGGSDGGTTPPTDGGDPDGGGWDGGDPDGGDPDAGTGPSVDPTAGMPNPEDDGSSGGNEGPQPLGPVGVISLGGGYVDPNPVDDGSSGGSTSGPMQVVPGGGVTDPPADDGSGGFDAYGTFHPPINGASDPVVDGAMGAYRTSASARAQTSSTIEGVRVTALSGVSATGMALTGLVSAAVAVAGRAAASNVRG